jgi:hypothetical protein
MKRLLLFILLFQSIATHSQSLKEFWGVKFGDSKDSAKAKVLMNHNIVPNSKSDGDIILFNAKTFAGEKCEYIAFCFVDNKFYKGVVFLSGDNNEETFDIYDRLKAKLSQKYRSPVKDIESYKYPYEKGDGHRVTAVKLGKASILCQWTISSDGVLDGYISMMITNDLSVGLQYEDALYSEIAKRKQLTKESKDL